MYYIYIYALYYYYYYYSYKHAAMYYPNLFGGDCPLVCFIIPHFATYIDDVSTLWDFLPNLPAYLHLSPLYDMWCVGGVVAVHFIYMPFLLLRLSHFHTVHFLSCYATLFLLDICCCCTFIPCCF